MNFLSRSALMGPRVAAWPMLIAALAFGAIEWLALTRSALADRLRR
jgi:hypothetical protein